MQAAQAMTMYPVAYIIYLTFIIRFGRSIIPTFCAQVGSLRHEQQILKRSTTSVDFRVLIKRQANEAKNNSFAKMYDARCTLLRVLIERTGIGTSKCDNLIFTLYPVTEEVGQYLHNVPKNIFTPNAETITTINFSLQSTIASFRGKII